MSMYVTPRMLASAGKDRAICLFQLYKARHRPSDDAESSGAGTDSELRSWVAVGKKVSAHRRIIWDCRYCTIMLFLVVI